MALGTTNISVLLVQSTIGVFSTSSVGGLIAKAASGGVGGYAFYINETYETTGYRNGYLIPEATPHWNIWSNKIPAEWDYLSGGGPIELRLKRNELNTNGGYDFRLHDFREYDHTAVQPELSVASSFNFVGNAGDVSWLTNFHQIALPIDVTHILAKVTIGTQVKTLNMLLENIIDSSELIQGYSLSFTNVTQTSGTLQLFASNNQGVELATLENIVSTKNFTINLLPNFATLSRSVLSPYDQDIIITGSITIPTGTGNIQLAVGTTQLTGIRMRFIAQSTIYSQVNFDLYLQQTEESDKYVGNYNINAGDPALFTNISNISVILNSATAGGDNLGFIMENLVYS